MSVFGSINGTLQITDNIVGSIAQSILLNLSYAGTVSSYAETVTLSTSPTNVSLPVSPVQFLHIFNLDTVNAVIVTWTPTGGSSNIVSTIDPGGWIGFCQTGTTNGITALSLQGASGTPAVKYLLLG